MSGAAAVAFAGCAAAGRFGWNWCSVEPNTNAGRPSGTVSASNCALVAMASQGTCLGLARTCRLVLRCGLPLFPGDS